MRPLLVVALILLLMVGLYSIVQNDSSGSPGLPPSTEDSSVPASQGQNKMLDPEIDEGGPRESPEEDGTRALSAVTGVLTGRVQDTNGNHIAGALVVLVPIPGARVATPISYLGGDFYLGHEQGIQTVTDAGGRFQLEFVSSFSGALFVDAEGYQALTMSPIFAEVDTVRNLGALSLEEGQAFLAQVVDSEENPVPNVQVSSFHGAPGPLRYHNFQQDNKPEARRTHLTEGDSDGRFELHSLNSGGAKLLIESPSFPRAVVVVSPAMLAERFVHRIQLERGIDIRGAVLLPPDLDPQLLEVTLRIPDHEGGKGLYYPQYGVPVDADGTFDFGRISDPSAEGPYFVQVTAVTPTSKRGRVVSDEKEAYPGDHDVELELTRLGRIRLTIIDQQTQEGIPGVSLWVGHWRGRSSTGVAEPLGITSRTNTGEIAAWASLPPPEHELGFSVHATGYESLYRRGLVFGAEGTLELGTLELKAVGRRSVCVVDADTLKPIPGATVRVLSDANPRATAENGVGTWHVYTQADWADEVRALRPVRNFTTDVEGCVVVGLKGEGADRMVAWAPGYSMSDSQEPRNSAESPGLLRVLLHRGAKLRVEVKDQEGEPIPGRKVRLERNPKDPQASMTFGRLFPGDPSTPKVTMPGGVATWTGLSPGQYRVLVRPAGGAGGAPDIVQMTMQPDTPVQTVTVVLEGGVRVTGRVTLGDEPLTDAIVVLVREGRSRSLLDGGPFSAPSHLGRNARTDRGGRFTIDNVISGQYQARIYAEGLLPVPSLDVRVSSKTTKVDLDIKKGSLSGVLMSSSGEVLADAQVCAFAEGDSESILSEILRVGNLSRLDRQRTSAAVGSTDADGNFRLTLVAGVERVCVLALVEGYTPLVACVGGVQAGLDTQVPAMVLEVGCELTVETTLEWVGPYQVVARCLEPSSGIQSSIDVRMVYISKSNPVELEKLRPGTWSISIYNRLASENSRVFHTQVELSPEEPAHVLVD